MQRKRIAFSDFLNFSPEDIPLDCGEMVKSSPKMQLPISNSIGEGHIITMPMIGGAGLVFMECTFNEDIEVYTHQAQQQGLSFTLCMQGKLISCCHGQPDTTVAQHETLFVRTKKIVSDVSSYFVGGEKHSYLTIQLSQEWLQAENHSEQLAIFNDPFWQGIYNSGAASHVMLTVAHEIIDGLREQHVNQAYISAKVLELWSHKVTMLERLTSGACGKHNLLRAKDLAPIHQAAHILSKEMAAPPSLLELSRRIGINDNKLKNDFKQVYGVTVFGYLHKYRLKKAKMLITKQKYSIAEAADAVGFSSHSHFSSVFKQAYGLSPRQLRDAQSDQ